jgi:hypothetical protein
MPKNYLVIGCGTEDHQSYEFTDRQESHEALELHPDNLFDTLDVNRGLEPTYVLDINKTQQLVNTINHQYELIILERFPTDYFQKAAADSLSHLLAENGIVIWVATGDRIQRFYNYIEFMQQAGFTSCSIGSDIQLMFFSKLPALAHYQQIRKMRHQVPFVAELFSNHAKFTVRKDALKFHQMFQSTFELTTILNQRVACKASLMVEHFTALARENTKKPPFSSSPDDHAVNEWSNQFKTCYLQQYNKEVIKKSSSSMLTQVHSTEILSAPVVIRYAIENSSSRTVKVLQNSPKLLSMIGSMLDAEHSIFCLERFVTLYAADYQMHFFKKIQAVP